MRWVKSPGNVSLKQEYQKLKVQSKKCADKAREEWWEAKAEEAERLHEAAVRLGHVGSLLKDLKLYYVATSPVCHMRRRYRNSPKVDDE